MSLRDAATLVSPCPPLAPSLRLGISRKYQATLYLKQLHHWRGRFIIGCRCGTQLARPAAGRRSYESFVLPPFALRIGSKIESMPHSLISQTCAISSPSRPFGKVRCLNQSRYSSGKSKMGTPWGGYFSFPNIPKGMWVRWISMSRLRKSSRSVWEIFINLNRTTDGHG